MDRLQMIERYFLISTMVALVRPVSCIVVTFAIEFLNLCPPNKKQKQKQKK